MAAYAAAVSVMNIMEQIQNHRQNSFSFDKKQMESLRGHVNFLVDFLECCCPDRGSKVGESLETRIASAAYAAEDVLESNVVYQIHAGSTLNGETSTCFLVDLQKVIEDMDSIKKLAMEVKAQTCFRDQLATYSRPATSSRPLYIGKKVTVRYYDDSNTYDDELIRLMERLTGQHHNRQIIPIVGMGGIGKTTLAKNVYESLVIVHHFDVCLWATVSQDYSANQILIQLLSCLKNRPSKPVNELGVELHNAVHELGEQLHKSLCGRRYLVVLDDMWSMGAWDEIQLFFPHNNNGSSIVITTRLSTMATHLGSKSFEMKFLGENTSWQLLCEKVFGEESCPLELEEIGKKISKNCKGLPLSIVVIGGHLRKSLRSKEYWELVASDINSILSSGYDDHCLKMLSLSYSYLPVYLKPCFLYMGVYPEDGMIWVHELIRLWVAEGFLKPNKVQSLEEVAEGYLRDLIDRNLVLVGEWSYAGEIEFCKIHDLSRELSLREAEKEKFFCVLNNDTTRVIITERRVVVRNSPMEQRHPKSFDALRSAQFVRTLWFDGGKLLFDFKLLRVLSEIDETSFDNIQQVNLRYICSINWETRPYLSSSIAQLWNLQTLIIHGRDMKITVPSEIWEMPQLRHVIITNFSLSDPPHSSNRFDQRDELVLQNLQTVGRVYNFRMSEEVCKRIPNIKVLGVGYDDFLNEGEARSFYFSQNLGRFHKLISLSLYFACDDLARDFARSFTFPSSLRELYIEGCRLHWEDLTMIGALPYLEVLELKENSVKGLEWKPIEGEFPRLKYLLIELCELISWNADNSHFPVLEQLCLISIIELEEIPSGIGEIPTLDLIKLYCCSMSAAISAMKILVEQESLGNEGLHLTVYFGRVQDLENFREKLEKESLRSDNLFVELEG